MEIEERSFQPFRERDELEIMLLCDVAKANGSILSIRELSALLPVQIAEEELERAFKYSQILSSAYLADSGLIFPKTSDILGSTKENLERAARAESSIMFARRFARFVTGTHVKILGVSGSASYNSVSEKDDLDFFAVTNSDTTWIFLTKALLLGRVGKVVSRHEPNVCFSYTMDERFAKKEFAEPKDRLFARDALSAVVVHGLSNYKRLLSFSLWMTKYFEKLYRLRTKGASNLVENTESSKFLVIANLFLYFLVGNYVRVKSHMLNRRFARQKDESRSFRLRMSPHHCIYESNRYLGLRRMYSRLDRGNSATERAEHRKIL